MNKIFVLTIHLYFYLCLIGSGKQLLEFENTESHLDRYSHINKTHHDNIDDNVNNHSHSHKHNEDGEEHEHNHEHTKITQYEIKIYSQIKYDQIDAKEFETTEGFFEKHLVSTPHLLEIFKPPIA
jgi:ABC-type Zn2+ transport system substrate-binding protein/surface adhesin